MGRMSALPENSNRNVMSKLSNLGEPVSCVYEDILRGREILCGPVWTPSYRLTCMIM